MAGDGELLADEVADLRDKVRRLEQALDVKLSLDTLAVIRERVGCVVSEEMLRRMSKRD